MAKSPLYFDAYSTTPILPEVIKSHQNALKIFGNPSSHHSVGRLAKDALESSREIIARTLGCDRDTVVFTASGSEANNMVLKSVALTHMGAGTPCHIITSPIEHSCVLKTCAYLESLGVSVSYLPVTASGQVQLEAIPSLLRPETRLISVMLANNETGAIQAVETIRSFVGNQVCLVHTDAVQAYGKISVDVSCLDVDFLSVSAHKIHGPKGVGVLYVKNDHTLHPLIHGGSQERKLRAGTENVPAICAAATAADLAHRNLSETTDYLRSLQHLLSDELSRRIGHCVINTDITHSLPSVLNISFPRIDAHALLMNLDLAGVAVSTGSACSTGSVEPSHVLQAMGVSEAVLRSAIRFSFSKLNTRDEVVKVAEITEAIVNGVLGATAPSPVF